MVVKELFSSKLYFDDGKLKIVPNDRWLFVKKDNVEQSFATLLDWIEQFKVDTDNIKVVFAEDNGIVHVFNLNLQDLKFSGGHWLVSKRVEDSYYFALNHFKK